MRLAKIAPFFFFTASLAIAHQQDWATDTPESRLVGQTIDVRDYELGPGDLVEISVYGVDSLHYELRVSSSGRLSLPLIGKISVAGLTGQEVEDRLTEIMAERKLVREPQVSLFIKEYRSQPLYVLGAVNQPGQYTMTQRLTILDAIAMAGGLNLQRADRHAYVRRASPPHPTVNGEREDDGPDQSPPPQPEVLKVDLKALLEQGDPAANIAVQGGDVIQIPEREIELFYVVGDVGRAGAYEFPSDSEVPLLLTQAVVKAGGPTRTAKMSDGILVRYQEDGSRKELAVDFKAILRGRRPDIPVQPNDIIFIPGSTAKTLGYGLLGIIPGTVQGTIIWGSR